MAFPEKGVGERNKKRKNCDNNTSEKTLIFYLQRFRSNDEQKKEDGSRS